jgi:hypothetical protein
MYPQDAIEILFNSRIVIKEDYLYHFYFDQKAQSF